MISLISSALIMLSPHQPLAHARELPVETTVENEATDLGDESAQEIGVRAFFQDDALAHELSEPAAEALLVFRRERHGRAHLSARFGSSGPMDIDPATLRAIGGVLRSMPALEEVDVLVTREDARILGSGVRWGRP